ncbi:hypothetical protein AQJ91_01835 [Streptomyces dysideae]|uniref:Uncharacterized protein n=1 Tax=Streptomyces dysideae TaxID=909626 RepID=A0A101V5B2_9ACTN|nr:hypothetical protein AQJ91_01835 [Streptomyces dysideae]
MGIRTLHRRTAPALADAHVGAVPTLPSPSVPVFAAGASTARIPTDLMTSLRRRRPGPAPLRRRLWADLARGCLALALNRLPRSRPAGPVTVFVAGALSERPDGSAVSRPRPHPNPNCQGPGPDATP